MQKLAIFLTVLLSILTIHFRPAFAEIPIPGPVVSPHWLSKHLDQVRVLDVRRLANSKLNPGQVEKNFIPGGVLVPFSQVVGSTVQQGKKLKGMTLAPSSFAKLMAKSGVKNSDTIILTNPGKSILELTYMLRLYWSLKFFNHASVAILDGGTAHWLLEKLPTTEKNSPPPSHYLVEKPNQTILAGVDDVKLAQQQSTTQLLDNRALKYYLGDELNENVVPAQGRGHIPGAYSLPISQLTTNLNSIFHLQNLEDILEMADMSDLDLTKPTILYCDTGNYGSVGWFILHELLGNKKTKLFDGSMHQWAAFNLPVKQGESP
ncbi:MAG: sulfurtransferase [Magnetococcales bacterium]|nr:sulfurtransferase [Magnetococcales bacterium]